MKILWRKFKNYVERKKHQTFLDVHHNLSETDKIFTHLTTQEKRKLFELASYLPEHSYALEIGSYIGSSACFISSALSENSKLICIDTWANNAMSEGVRDTLKEFEVNTAPYSEKIIKVKGFSTEVTSEIKKETHKVDLLFIDGDHSYQGCKADWDAYLPFLKNGSCVVFHDIGWAEGVQKVVCEEVLPLLDSYHSLPNMFYGYIK